MQIDFRSLKVKVWLYFVLFSIIILTVLWLLQVIFIQSFYQDLKINEIIKIGNTIANNYENENIDNIINESSFKNNLLITIYDANSNIVKSSMFGTPPGPGRGPGSQQPPDDFVYLKQRLLDSGENSIHYTVGGPRMARLFYGCVLSTAAGTPLYLSITATLPPIDPAIEILKNQLVYITIILFLLAFIIAYIFSRHLSKPIVKLTQTAKQLAANNLDVIFEKGNYTEIDQLAGALNYATQEISRVDILRKDLIANISHDLRTPLTIIKFYGEMIKDISGDNPEKRREHAELIMKESDRMASLVNNILEFSKAQSEKLALNCRKFNISNTVHSVITRFHELTRQDGYIFKLELAENLYANADEEQIERVLYNLISNAINYTGDDKTITVQLKNFSGKVRFAVTDTGYGIPEDQLQNIWERYYKVKETHKRAVVGNGLGLSIVKHILQHHNAKFGVDSTVGRGSTFWFEL